MPRTSLPSSRADVNRRLNWTSGHEVRRQRSPDVVLNVSAFFPAMCYNSAMKADRTRVALFSNGIIEAYDRLQPWFKRCGLVIAADGGTRHALAMGRAPDVVIGDLDSLDATMRGRLTEETRLLAYPRDKDQTDLELALAYAISQGAREIFLFGMLGGRLDQMLANVLLLTQPAWGAARLFLFGEREIAQLLRDGETAVLHGVPGQVVSLLPFYPVVTGVTTEGLAWPLRNADLSLGSTMGVSNEMASETARVWIRHGRLLVVHEQFVDRPVRAGVTT